MLHINYKLIGKGEKTVLFLHGWGEDINSFLFSFPKIPNDYQILTLDIIGFGESDKLKYVFSVFDYASKIYELLKLLHINDVIIVSHSFGGRIAILLSTMFNINIQGLMFCDVAGIKPRYSIVKNLKILYFKFLKFLNKHKLINLNINKYGSNDYRILNRIEKESFSKVINFNEKKYLKLIKTKNVVIYWGDKDKSTPYYMAKILNKNINGSRLVRINNGNHFCFLTHKNLFCYYLQSLL